MRSRPHVEYSLTEEGEEPGFRPAGPGQLGAGPSGEVAQRSGQLAYASGHGRFVFGVNCVGAILPERFLQPLVHAHVRAFRGCLQLQLGAP